MDKICLRDFNETEPGKTSRTELAYVNVYVAKQDQNNKSIPIIYQTDSLFGLFC